MKLPLTTEAADQELRDIATIMRIIRRHSIEVRGRIMHYCAQRADEFDDDGKPKAEAVPQMPSTRMTRAQAFAVLCGPPLKPGEQRFTDTRPRGEEEPSTDE